MVNGVMSLTNNGLRDWLVQRVSAVIIGFYAIFLLLFFFFHPQLSYEQWIELFSNAWMRIISAIVLVSVFLHAWIGVWRVTGDYITNTCIRISSQLLIILMLFGFFVWGIEILWSI